MDSFTFLEGRAAPLPSANVDTDQIIPKQYLKTVTREGLGRGLFHDLRYREDGSLDPDFVLNQPAYEGATILIAGDNFGCGSSREHAPWALADFGIRCVVATSFGDIFSNNCLQNGILLVTLDGDTVQRLEGEARGGNHLFAVDLKAQTITAPSGTVVPFSIDPGARDKLLRGLDAIGETLVHAGDIDEFEARMARQPWREMAA